MNKVEYLQILKQALSNMDEAVLQEIISDFEEHFRIGMEHGKDEQSICDELGPISDLVKDIKEAYDTTASRIEDDETEEKETWDEMEQDEKQSKWSKEWKFSFDTWNGEKISDAINSAINSAGEVLSNVDVKEMTRHVKRTVEEATSSFQTFAEEYLKHSGKSSKYEQSGFQSEEEDSSSVCDVYTYDMDTTQADTTYSNTEDESNKQGYHLCLEGLCADVEIRTSNNGKLTLSCKDRGAVYRKQRYEFYSNQTEHTIYAGLRKVGKTVFRSSADEDGITILVELPEDMEHVTIKTTRGDVEIADISVGQFVTETLSGSICANGLKAQTIRLKTISGDICTKHTTADHIHRKTTSGTIDVQHSTSNRDQNSSIGGDVTIREQFMNHMDVSSISGDIKLSDVTGDELHVSSTSGDAILSVNVKTCQASSKSGDVKVLCSGDITLEASTLSGDVRVLLKNYGNGYRISSKSLSGGLYIKYGEERHRELKTGTYCYGNEGSELVLTSLSGDLHVNN